MKDKEKTKSGLALSDQAVDDFTRIHGIGQAVERRLHQAGIMTYRQLADQSPEELAAWLEDMVGFNKERIIEQNWTEKADQLAGRAGSQQKHEQQTNQGMAGLQHHGFTVELLLDEDQHVRQTRAQHIRTKKEDSWAGWDGARLKRFLVETSGALIPTEGQAEPTPEASRTRKPAASAAPEMTTTRLAGEMNIRNVSLLGTYGHSINMLAREGEKINVRLDLDLSRVELAGDQKLQYEAMLYARPVGQGDRFLFGAAQGTLIQAPDARIDIVGEVLSAGQYRLEAVVILRDGEAGAKDAQLMALSEGKFIRVVGMN